MNRAAADGIFAVTDLAGIIPGTEDPPEGTPPVYAADGDEALDMD